MAYFDLRCYSGVSLSVEFFVANSTFAGICFLGCQTEFHQVLSTTIVHCIYLYSCQPAQFARSIQILDPDMFYRNIGLILTDKINYSRRRFRTIEVLWRWHIRTLWVGSILKCRSFRTCGWSSPYFMYKCWNSMAPRLGHEGSGFLSVEDNEALRRVFAYPENCVASFVCVCVCVCVWDKQSKFWRLFYIYIYVYIYLG